MKEVTDIMKNAVALYMRKPNALVHNQKTYITPGRDVIPYYKDGKPMLPVLFFAESIGARAEGIIYSADRSENGCVTLIKGKKKQTISSVELHGNQIFASAEELCRAFGMYLFYDEADMLIYSEEELNLSWTKDLELLRKIAESFIFDDVTGAEIVELLQGKCHPRMLMTTEKFETIRTELAKGEDCDPVYKVCMQKIREKAESFLNQKPAFYEIRDGVRLLYVSQEVLEKVTCLSLMYRLTLEERYAVRARQELIAVCSFQDWHPYHFLDVGEMTAAVAFGYDWLYDWLDEGDKALIRKAIVENAFEPIIEDYDDVPRERTWRWREKPVCNWRFIAGGGTACGAIAIADELMGAELTKAERVLAQSLLDIREPISLFAPDGGYEEGLGYWAYACKYYMFHIGSLKTATGWDFGYLDAPGLRHTAEFILSAHGSVSRFGFHDCADSKKDISPLLMFWALHFEDYAVAGPAVDQILQKGGSVEALLSYDPLLRKNADLKLPLDSMRKTVGVFSARSGYEQEALWVGFHVDDAYAGPSHDHMDVGSFNLDACGVNFFSDLGSDNYNIPDYYRDVYVFRAEGHNVFVINPDAGPGQRYGGKAFFDRYESGEDGAFASADLTDIYKDHVICARRTVSLCDRRSSVTVQDEIVMKEPSEFYWFAHTFADIHICEDGRKAYLTREGKTLLAEILTGEGATFSVMEAKPLPVSPNPPGQKSTVGVSKLTIHMTGAKNINLTVVFHAYDKER